MTDRLQQIKETWWWGGERGVRPLSGPDTEWLIAEVERLRDGSEYWGMNQELTEQIATLRTLVDDLTDPDDCQYDHHGYCQAHGWMETDPSCPHKRAKALATEAPQ